jgi:hypothetical protein
MKRRQTAGILTLEDCIGAENLRNESRAGKCGPSRGIPERPPHSESGSATATMECSLAGSEVPLTKWKDAAPRARRSVIRSFEKDRVRGDRPGMRFPAVGGKTLPGARWRDIFLKFREIDTRCRENF